MYEVRQGVFLTPKGRPVEMLYRDGTNDWSTLNSCLTEDEYGLKALSPLSGVAIDVGAYLGGVAVALAVDNPDCHVIAIEPVPPNVDLLRRNVELNALQDRIEVVAGAVGAGRTTVSYAYRGSVSLEHHAFVGNSTLAGEFTGEAQHDQTDYDGLRLSELTTEPISFLKIDCEGCEWQALRDLPPVERIHGEWHPTNGHELIDLLRLLSRYDVTFSGPEAGPGGFVAVAR